MKFKKYFWSFLCWLSYLPLLFLSKLVPSARSKCPLCNMPFIEVDPKASYILQDSCKVARPVCPNCASFAIGWNNAVIKDMVNKNLPIDINLINVKFSDDEEE